MLIIYNFFIIIIFVIISVYLIIRNTFFVPVLNKPIKQTNKQNFPSDTRSHIYLFFFYTAGSEIHQVAENFIARNLQGF